MKTDLSGGIHMPEPLQEEYVQGVRPVLIDTDPGVDDTLAIMLCASAPSVSIKAITAVAGNVSLDHTYENALLLKKLFGLTDTIVSKGAEKPLVLPAGRVTVVHGSDGLGGLSRKTDTQPDPLPAWERIYQTALQEKGDLEILALGPLTNIALALRKHPDLKDLISQIVIMGGSGSCGNVTPHAEFNSWVDPDACEEVFRSGVPLLLCGLDGLQPAALEFSELDLIISEFGSYGGVTGDFAVPIIRFIRNGRHGWGGNSNVVIYDLATAVCFLHPEQAVYRSVHLSCETDDEVTLGKTLISESLDDDLSGILTSMDKETYVQCMRSMLKHFSGKRICQES